MSIDLTTCKIGPAAAVSDLGRAREFYEGPLGLRPIGEDGDEAVRYACGDNTVLTVYRSAYAGQTAATVAGFEVPDVSDAVTDLSSRGVTFEQYDQPGIKTDERGIFDPGPFRAAWFRDPDGNTFAITGQ
jgi:catechol 2,3-dioxygenase-like lactoylglutathione lyase family enzyme